MDIHVQSPGGMLIDARFGDFTVSTDQTVADGGTNSAPSPFDLFLASIGTCAGLYALRFCQKREIDTAGLGIQLETVRDPESRRLTEINLHLSLPPAFPDKYQKAIVRAINQCAVKKAIVDPPEISTIIR